MSSLIPSYRMDVAYDRNVYGLMKYAGDTISWDLPSLIGQGFGGSNGAIFNGFCLDPTGLYVIQTPQFVPIDVDETKWTTSGNGGFSHGTNPTTGKLILTQTIGGPNVNYGALTNGVRESEVGLLLDLYWGETVTTPGGTQATGTNYAMYIEFNVGRQPILGNPAPGYRLAMESGKPIRLEGTYDDINWITLDVANTDLDSYLKTRQRHLVIDVFPMTDFSWWTGQPQSSLFSDAPPDTLCISINGGDILLKYATRQLTFPGGQVYISGVGGQWSLGYAKRRYVTVAEAILPEQVRFRAFQTQANGRIVGYAPFGDFGAVAVNLTGPSKAAAALVVATPDANIDQSNGFAYQTVILSGVQADFPASFLGPQNITAYTSYYPVQAEEDSSFDQTSFCVRTRASVKLVDNSGALAPGNVIPAVRAVALYRGFTTSDGLYDDRTYGLAGFWGVDAGEGLSWEWIDRQKYLTVEIQDKLARGDGCVTVGWRLPDDGQCHYYVMRTLAYRLGIIDDFLNFPYCGRDSQCGHYHLEQGTNAEPLLQPHPSTDVHSYMLLIRQLSGEPAPGNVTDPFTGLPLILPMYMYVDHTGVLQYFPMPLGVAQTFLDPSLNIYVQQIPPFKTFSAQPQFSAGAPVLSEFIQGTMRSVASLANIRTPIIAMGESPIDGSFNIGWSYNDALGGSSTANPNAFGYVGIDIPYANISKFFTTPQAALNAAIMATIQSSFPSVKTVFTAHMQSNLQPLTVIGVQDFATQGNTLPVSYYTTRNLIRYRDDGTNRSAISQIHCRLLGQAN